MTAASMMMVDMAMLLSGGMEPPADHHESAASR
jgi:hypothetical protein